MIPQRQQPPGVGRFIGVVFGFAFAGIGLTVIVALWTVSGFGEPPLFFKIVGSFIAIVFITVGSPAAFAAVNNRRTQISDEMPPQNETVSTKSSGYECPACGARLGEGVDVSPKGDVKCGCCKQWFNIHG